MKARIINFNYAYVIRGSRLVLERTDDQEKPWTVAHNSKLRRFSTHAEAIHHAQKRSRKENK